MARPLRGVAAAFALAAALLSICVHAHLEFGNYKVQQIANEVVSFLLVGEWGGQSTAPYTTPGQLAVASAMAGVATTSASTFVLSPGGNFYGDGIQGSADSDIAQTRLLDTWNNTYNAPYPALAALPWYTVAGSVDWAGNVSAEMGFNGTNNGQFLFPDLFYTFQSVVPYSGDTIEFIMIDTESLIGGLNPMPSVLPALYYPPPAPGTAVAPSAAVAGYASGPAAAYGAAAEGVYGAAASDTLAAPTAVYGAAAATPAAASVYPAATPTAATSVYGAAAASPTAATSVYGAAAASPTAATSAYGAAAASPTAAASAYGAATGAASVYGRRRLSGIDVGYISTGTNDPGVAQPYIGYTAPSINDAQWNWVEHAINSSYADWIIVVGNHPVWSPGLSGPTWPLVERLAPIMEAAGVALYIGGKDHQMAHFKPVPATNNVEYVVLGNGAYFNDNATVLNAHAADCPYGGLSYQYSSSTGFAQIKISHGIANTPGLLKMTFYDGSGDVLYDFYKENPRTEPGHTAGNLGAPPSPSPLNANAGSGGPMVIISGFFIAIAVSMGLWIAASHALATMGYRSVRGAGYGGAGLSEHSPLMPGGVHGVVNL